MGVFPAASSKHVPEPWAELMSSSVRCFFDSENTLFIWNIFIGIRDHRFLP